MYNECQWGTMLFGPHLVLNKKRKSGKKGVKSVNDRIVIFG